MKACMPYIATPAPALAEPASAKPLHPEAGDEAEPEAPAGAEPSQEADPDGPAEATSTASDDDTYLVGGPSCFGCASGWWDRTWSAQQHAAEQHVAYGPGQAARGP